MYITQMFCIKIRISNWIEIQRLDSVRQKLDKTYVGMQRYINNILNKCKSFSHRFIHSSSS